MVNAVKKIVCIKHKEIDLIGDYKICIKCGECRSLEEEPKVPLRPIHFIILKEIIEVFPAFFRKNRTKFFYSEMWRYAFEGKVYRITIMGETRGGKSEEAQTVGINFCRIFNALYKEGHYKDMNIFYQDKTKLSLGEIKLSDDYIHANQSVYLYHLRDTTRERKLNFGQMHIIDEDRDNPGGIGSFSEDIEVLNVNNITAKFMQCEIWITPRRFQTMNTPYGLNCLIKDKDNRMNWSLIYKIEMNSSGLREQNFLGWTGIALHKDNMLREKYQNKKDTWIEQELGGGTNERVTRRMKAIDYMLTDDNFTQFTINKSGEIRWHHGIEAMKYLVEEAMMNEKIDPFNETEIERIVHGARAKGEKQFKEVKQEV